MRENVLLEGESLFARIVALYAFVRFLPTVNKGMLLQTAGPSKILVTLYNPLQDAFSLSYISKSTITFREAFKNYLADFVR